MLRGAAKAGCLSKACGAGCEKHEERVGPLKSDAIRAHAARRQRVHDDPMPFTPLPLVSIAPRTLRS